MNELNFTAESIKLLDSFIIPSNVIYNRKILHSNCVPPGVHDLNIDSVFDESSSVWEDESTCYVKIRQCNIRIDIKRSGNSEYMLLKINYNKIPCYLVMYNRDCGGLSFKECIDYINSRKGIEKILIVDDDPVLIQTYEMILDLLGYQSYMFTNPKQFINRLGSIEFDLLISDYNMPDMNGFELVEKLKEVKPHIPVIICSGTVEIYKGMFRTSCDRNPVSLLSKPVTIKKLSDSIEVMEFISKICSFCREMKGGE